MKLLLLKRIVKVFPYLAKETIYRFYSNLKNSQSVLAEDEKSMLSWLLIKSHIIEKGLTMPNMKLGFGFDRIRELVNNTRRTIECFSNEHIEVQIAINDLEQYLLLHQEKHFVLPCDISEGIRSLLKYKTSETEKCFYESRTDFFKHTQDFKMFAYQRHSVRWYSQESIPSETIKKSILLAQRAPSACNRQSIKVYVVSSDDKKKQILNLQTGNRGFGYMADKILLITSDERCWTWREEAMGYIDAGIFTMNLLYALHYYEICACTLNAIMSIDNRKLLRNICGYSKTEIPMVFIAIGRAPDKFMIPGSQRIHVDDICQFV